MGVMEGDTGLEVERATAIPITDGKKNVDIEVGSAEPTSGSSNHNDVQAQEQPVPEQPATLKERTSWQLWAVITPLFVNNFIAAIEATILSAALPVIVTELEAGVAYVWFVNAYLLTKAAFIPLWGQLAGIAGRKWPLMIAVSLFLLGSGIAGGANSTSMMIGGRAVQGTGGGGMTIIGQLIISDLVSPRQVPKYVGYLFVSLGIGTAIGPFIGGLIVERTSWRWVFWINLPIGGAALIIQYILLRQISYTPSVKIPPLQKLKRVDFVGNFLIIAATSLTLIALSWGGAAYPWTSPQVLCLLILGILGLVGAMCYETWSPWVREQPTIHTVILGNYSTDVNLVLAFMQHTFSIWTVYFLPVYFQGVMLRSAEMAGVLLLPSVIVPFALAVLVGRLITRWGRYKVFHVAGTALVVLGYGLFTVFDAGTSVAVVVVVQVVWNLGLGQLMTSTLPGVQASVDEKLRGTATSTWGFFREFGGLWGTAVPGAIFNSRFGALIEERVTDAGLRGALERGNGYSFASAELIGELAETSRREVIGVFTDSIKLVFQVAIGLSGICFILAAVQQEYELRKTHTSDYGLKKKNEAS